MLGSKSLDVFDLEIEWTFKRRKREKKKEKLVIVDMAEREPDIKAVGDYSTPDVTGIPSSIATLSIQANNFKTEASDHLYC